jgi:Protein of unknown function (DUF2442)
MTELPYINQVEPDGPHQLRLWFSDGSVGLWVADVSEFFGVMGEPLRDADFFAQAFVKGGAVVWPNGFDASPMALYTDIRDAGRLTRPIYAA